MQRRPNAAGVSPRAARPVRLLAVVAVASDEVGYCRWRSLLRQRELTEPLFEARLAKSRAIAGNQRALAEFGSEVPRVRVGDNLARVVARAEALSNQLIEAELLRTGHFDGAIQWRAHGDPPDRLGDV